MDVKRYKAGTLKGELTTAEIRKLIRAHNKASSIKIPPKSSREDIIGILKNAGYSVNHEKAELRPVSKGKVQKLKVISQKTIAEELPKPKPLTEEQKKQRQQAKQKKAGEKAFLKAVIPKPPSVSKPSKKVKKPVKEAPVLRLSGKLDEDIMEKQIEENWSKLRDEQAFTLNKKYNDDKLVVEYGQETERAESMTKKILKPLWDEANKLRLK
jgi:hypothetical protein